MNLTRTRTVLLGIAIAVAVASAVPILSATTSAGSLQLTSPVSNDVLSGRTAQIGWTWRTGTLVKSTSTVEIKLTDPTGALLFARKYRAARYGSWTLNTTAYPEGAYAIIATIRGTSISSRSGPFLIDNKVPDIEITQPRGGDVVWLGEAGAGVQSTPMVSGATTLAARVTDMTQTSVAWFLDGEQLEGLEGNLEDENVTYDFGTTTPGEHTLTATATDLGDNVGESAPVEIIVLPSSASVDAGEVPNPEDLIPSEDPTLPVDPDNPPAAPNPEDLIGEPPVDPDDPPVDPDDPPAAPNPEDLVPSQDPQPPVPLP